LWAHNNVWVSRQALDRRRPYRGLWRQRPLRIRLDPKRGVGSESLSRCILRQGRGHSSSQLGVTPGMEAKLSLFTIQKVHGAKVIHHRLRGEERGLSSPLMNNFWSNYKGRGERLATFHVVGAFLSSMPAATPHP